MSTGIAADRPPTRFIVPCVLAVAILATLLGLGTWQLQRKAWKDALVATLDARLAADPQALPPSDRWASLDQAGNEFRRVVVPATLVQGDEALVYASGSDFGDAISRQGYLVFTPGHLASGATVVLNRGFIPEGQKDPQTHRTQEGRARLTGIMRWPEPRTWFSPSDNPAHNLWFVRDHLAMAAAKGWGNVAPFYIVLDTASGPDTLPKVAPLKPNLRNEHLNYAITWYGLAAVFVVVFALWLRGSLRERRTAAGVQDSASSQGA